MVSLKLRNALLLTLSRRNFLSKLGFLAAALSGFVSPVLAGDSLYGKIVEVKSADVVVLDYGAGQYTVRIVGIDAPKQRALADQAKKFVSDLILGKNVRLRLERRAENGELIAKLSTDDPVIGIKDVGIELLTAGLAQRQPNFDYKYNELSVAENDAKKVKRGLWALPQ